MRVLFDHQLDAAAGLAPREQPAAANDLFEEVVVGGLKIVRLTRAQLARQMIRDCLAARRSPTPAAKTVFAANGHAVALAAVNRDFQAMFDAADIVHADGQALIFASRLLTSTPVPERSPTTDFIHDAAKVAVDANLRFFLLGATEEVNARCAEELERLYPGLQIAGRRHGYFSHDEEEAICAEINASETDVVWCGLGVPFEYEFVMRNKHRLTAGWIVTCGGCFNFVSGAYRRAPQWMQRAGFEWLHRLVREPRRLFWRYAITNPIALAMLIARTARAGEGGPVPESTAVAAPLAAKARLAG